MGQVEEAISKRDEEEDTEQGVPRALVSRVTATSRVLKLPADTGPFAQAALTVTSAAPAPPHPAARNCDLGGAIAVARAACWRARHIGAHIAHHRRANESMVCSR